MMSDDNITVEERKKGEYLVCTENECQIIYAKDEQDAREQVMRNM
jgi:hypothetical protein